MDNVNPFVPTGERGTRTPQHRFNVGPHLWEIQPILIAPVLPGETLDKLSLQSRVVTPPVKSRLVGFWLEYFFFYVPFRQMPDAASLVAMFISPTSTLSATAASARDYYDGRGYNFVSQCLQVVTQEWFRREGESWSGFDIRAGRPAASLGIDAFTDSLIDATVLPSGGALSGETDDVIRAQMILEYRRQLAIAGADGGTVDYEELLSSYGAYVKKNKDRDRPELLRYIREWTYPTNTVEPTTGVPTTAASWSITDSADKARAFGEPGFVFGVQVVRPKVYLTNQTGNGASMLDRAQRWLPPMMGDVGAEKGLAEFTTTQGPLGKSASGFTNGYWLDVRDLFNYGDQYIDNSVANDLAGIALPTTAQQIRYATLAMANSLLVTTNTYSACDGAMNLRVKTRVVEAS